MRRNLYNKNPEDFVQALFNLEWREVTPNFKGAEREFRKRNCHLIMKKHSLGFYCVMHIDRFISGSHIHKKPITKGTQLTDTFRELIAEYKKVRGTFK